ncbi:MAG: NAD(P)/FAD-dependent oxidoreductase [Deltaproteobacteria bacterium]|nr:NAD(P)/FAD-dependent oxidoreductase [Deltaproteobacteria bacterium]
MAERGRRALIIGAGPAGLTAASELLRRTAVQPIVFEATGATGGLSQTVSYRGYRMDLGGHRFFSKSSRVMNWWLGVLPLERTSERAGPDPEREDLVMLLRRRRSRIHFLRKFFDYPLALTPETLVNLGPWLTARIVASYLRSVAAPERPERNLEQFFINRFGRELYRIFFKDYTEKVWGRACHEIDSEWGAQRVKGLSITRALADLARRAVATEQDLAQREVETSLIQQFLYPKHGPGQLWERVAALVREGGGEIHHRQQIVRVEHRGRSIVAIWARDDESGRERRVEGDYVFSSMPVRDLVAALGDDVPAEVKEVASALVYRDFITVGLVVKELEIKGAGQPRGLIDDNWIYIQDRGVKLGRLQIFNNWSPYMVADPGKVSLGLEYFCQEGDELWRMTDEQLTRFAAGELHGLGLIDQAKVLDAHVVRVPKAYPAYFGSYDRFEVVRRYLDSFENLFLIGRNGMHRYNNQDHSMLTAMRAVDNILEGIGAKDNIWAVNAEQEYHEEKELPGFTGYQQDPPTTADRVEQVVRRLNRAVDRLRKL